MTRIVLALSMTLLALGCSHKDARTGAKIPPDMPSRDDLSNPYRATAEQSTLYVGYVDYFPETHEFFTSLYYKDGYEHPDQDLLQSRLDSVIAFDEDWGRERLPMHEAQKFLVLSGLDTLSIFNRRQELIDRVPLVRVEYLWDGLESYFVAVFKAGEGFDEQTEELYGITAAHTSVMNDSFTETEITDSKLNAWLTEQLRISGSCGCDIRHYRIKPDETLYSIVSAYSPAEDKAHSYLVATHGGEVQVLNEEVDNFHFLNILPVPIASNGRPLLLISAGYPSSDVVWDYLAAWDGERYEAVDYNRIRVSDVSSENRMRVQRGPEGMRKSLAGILKR